MAITFRGSLATQYLMPLRDSICFVIENTVRSLCNLNILRIILQFDANSQDSGTGRIMPIVRARKGAATTSGGLVLTDRVPWDTTINAPSTGVVVRVDGGFTGVVPITISGTQTAFFEQYTARQVTGVEQWYSYDCALVDTMTSGNIVLRPGECLSLQWTMPATAPTAVPFIQAAWEEDTVSSGYTLSGVTTLSGTGVSGAKIILVTDTDRDLPNPQVEIITTSTSGLWSKTLASGIVASAFAQYRSGETFYTDEGKPYLSNI